uniref:Phospholipid scramblase n=1 Tax=Tetraodon nigroviridis TaxID=99883 RepID=H3DCW1_TETNG
MSAVTSQPLPFDRLEREKHIQAIFRAFKNRCGPTCQCQLPSPRLTSSNQTPPPDWESEAQSSPAPPGTTNSWPVEKRWSTAGTHFLSTLQTADKIEITARPEVQGPQCVPRRIYSIATGGDKPQLFVAVEESSCVCLQCCGPARACSLQGFDCQGRQVFYFERPLRVDACCLGCCLMEMGVYTPQKHLMGTVRQRWSMFTPLLEVCDADGASAVRIQGSCCPCRCFSNQSFKVVSDIGEEVGRVWKKWPGFNEEQNMDHEYFGLDVSLNVDSHTKLLLLAATFLLNHMFFEMS